MNGLPMLIRLILESTAPLGVGLAGQSGAPPLLVFTPQSVSHYPNCILIRTDPHPTFTFRSDDPCEEARIRVVSPFGTHVHGLPNTTSARSFPHAI